MVFPYSAFETRRENTGKREEDARMSEREAEGFPRPKETDSRCRVLQNVTEAWATTLLVFAGLEEQSGTGGVFARRKLSDNGIRERT